MKKQILLGIAMLAVASTAAFAQTAPAATAPTVPGYPDVKVVPVEGATPKATAGKPADGPGIRRQLSDSLTKAGYTDVKVMPEAFIVEAKNSAGDPVTMFLSPDSLTVFTAREAKGKDTSSVTGDAAAAAPAKP